MFKRVSRWKEQGRHFRTIPLSSKIIFLAGVASIFAAVGAVNDLLNLDSSSPGQLTFRVLLSAIPAIGWAYFGTLRMVRSMILLGAGQFLAFYVFARVFGNIHQNLSPRQFHDDIAIRASLTLAFVFAGYTLFIAFFRREGSRFFSVHTEIELASTIHRALVPPISGSRDGLEVYGLSVPSGVVGGDLLDVVHHPEGCLVYVADVSGHGVKAGVLMSMIKTSVHTRFATAPPCAEGLFEDLNQVLYPLMDPPSFATMGFILFQPDGVARFSLAGHLPVLHWRASIAQVEQHAIQNLPIAMFPSTVFEVGSLQVQPGDVLALVTDGLTEVFNSRKEELGIGYIEESLAQLQGQPLAEIYDRIMERSQQFGPITDDRTLLLIRVSS